MATILRPPLVSAAQRKSNIGAAFVAANLLVTTLAAAPATLPPGKQLHASAPKRTQTVVVENFRRPLTLGINPQPQIRQWIDQAPQPKRAVYADQFVPSQDQLNFVYLNSMGWEDSAPQAKPRVGLDTYPNLLANTLKPADVALALPLNAERWDDSAPVIRKDASCWQQPSVLVRGINPNAKVAGLIESAPQVKGAVYVQPPPNLLVTTLAPAPAVLGLPLNAGRQDQSAPRVIPPVRVELLSRPLTLGINPNAQVQGLTASAPPPKYAVQVDVYPNLQLNTLLPAPVGECLYASAPPPKFQVFAEQYTNYAVLGYPEPPTPPAEADARRYFAKAPQIRFNASAWQIRYTARRP